MGLGNITTNKASGGDGIPAELFQILKDDAVKVLYSICHKSGRLSSGHRTRKGQISFQSQRRTIPKNVQTTTQLCSSQASKVMLKILHMRLQQYMNQELPHVQAGFRKGREPEIKLPTCTQSWRKQGNFRNKHSFLLH